MASMRDRRDVYKVLVGRPKGRKPLGKPRRRWEDTIKMDLKKSFGRAWNGLIWIRRGTSGGLLYTWKCTVGFHKMWRISSIVGELVAWGVN